ncbi:DNA integrity scanning diadenylate cyclase DisA [Tessaracoccus palaemonis]|uniref:DNA integrity scanning diadenylate cyclase DisA n=1 Tax=Tessaracoccus palaemonis TaxID=2829499 RepID=A0ABX8SML1_9ACTN|nr:DNA integrity scanning diadenylate cyclase DisA [Tessaracoccus palaemonis]QXT62414.1 DNA integrity scanning diadenylate cyclase DisA [Tessaracoccus palaemonis]
MPKPTIRRYLKLLAPGTPLRAGVDRILHGRTGALIVLGNNQKVQQVSSGGFKIGVECTEQALRELAKLDGAIILSNDLSTIVAAGVHLVPAGDLPTAETGTRHRSADRTAQAAGVPVVTVSASMATVSVFLDGRRHLVESVTQVISRANQALATLSRVSSRLTDQLDQFTLLEIGEQVTLRDLTHVIHRLELTRRLSAEVDFLVELLGVEGRMVALQHSELANTFVGAADLLAEDYAQNLSDPSQFDLSKLANFSSEELFSGQLVAERLGFGQGANLEQGLESRGVRLLTDVGRLPSHLVSKLVDRYSLQELFGASVAVLMEIDGVGPMRARQIRDALLRISEGS